MDLFERLKLKNFASPLLCGRGRFVVDDNVGLALLLAVTFKEQGEGILVVTSNLYKAQLLYNQLVILLGNNVPLLFPNDELIRAETLAQSKEMIAQRIYVLDRLIKKENRIVIASVASATRYLPDPILFKELSINLKVGESYNISEIKKILVKNGYLNVNKVDQSLQFASRGDILDIFSVNHDYPIRVEFFGEEVESIRYFDIATQISNKKLEEVSILPASDVLLTEEEIQTSPDKILNVLSTQQKRLDWGDFETLRDLTNEDIVNILNHSYNPRIYKYFSFLRENNYTLFDYCENYKKVFVDDIAIEESNKILQQESFSYLFELSSNHRIIPGLKIFESIYDLVRIDSRYCVVTSTFMKDSGDNIVDISPILLQANKNEDAINIISSYLNDNYTVILAISNLRHINALQESLHKLDMPYEKVKDYDFPKKHKIAFTLLNFPNGFVLKEEKIVYLTGKELFNERIKISRFDNRFKEATILKSYEDLSPGDYVVHEYQGIGQFVELTTLETDGQKRDYLKIIYANDEKLYVPLVQFQLVRKFLGKEGSTPRLSRLHSKDWEKTKKKIKERINDLAERLMHLYIERSKIKGFSFPKDDELQEEFENSFPYELTHDQKIAIKAIKEDMEKETPMDRLLCGDVGFGKTEVAFQAAFKAILAGKQVAILCPTTLLARQHYKLAKQRFGQFDVRIAVLSRLIPDKLQKQYIKEIQEGKVHLIIGTHRILSKSVVFKDLGLLIIDEEQRFGVEQKEKLKELKNNIDVLTLSATPIPRTLQISLLGVRSLSKIDTPPSDRMPIQTYVAPYKEGVVKELIQREMGRQGQVFYLHNNISSIYECAFKLQTMVPNARIACAHGQLSKEEVEDIMLSFYNGEIDVLVCTSIIENGIDVPNANMIIVEDCDRYGLSQLYQIKGRVGRSSRIAYAYLFFNEYKVLNEKAQKRLKAIQEFTELSSGYKIAQRDLMIRGAGDILGPDQAGFIDSIGLDMYIKLLNEAVREKLGDNIDDNKPVASTFSMDAYIPSSYVNDSDKIELYQEILSAPNIEALSRIKIRTRDIYGKLPDEVNHLFIRRNIELLKEAALIDKLTEHPKYIELILNKEYLNIRGIGNILFETLIPYLQYVKMSYVSNIFKISLTKRKLWFVDLEEILKKLLNIKETHRTKEVL